MSDLDEMNLLGEYGSPAALKKLCLRTLVNFTLYVILLPSYKQFRDSEEMTNLLHNQYLDFYIVSGSRTSSAIPKRASLLNSLKRMKNFWENNEYVKSALLAEFGDYMTETLKFIDVFSTNPVMRLTLQLLFTSQMGDHPLPLRHCDIYQQLSKEGCRNLAEFFEKLTPFKIRKLDTVNIIFASPEPLIVILKNSSHLTYLSLKYNNSDYIMNSVRKYCPHLKTFIVQDFNGRMMFSENYLYKCFFGTKSKEDFLHRLTSRENIRVSFPNLKYMDVGKGNMALEFLGHVRVVYPSVLSMSCSSSCIMACDLHKYRPALNVPCLLEDICLTTYCLKNVDLDFLVESFPYVKHIVFSLETFSNGDKDFIVTKAKRYLKELKCFSITIQLIFDGNPWTELLQVYREIFRETSRDILNLQIEVCNVCDTLFLWDVICMFGNLSMLSIRVLDDGVLGHSGTDLTRLVNLHGLKAFSFHYLRECSEIRDFPFVSLLKLCSQIEHIEVINSYQCHRRNLFFRWLVEAAHLGCFKHLQTLTVGYGRVDRGKLLSSLVQRIPSLQKLYIVVDRTSSHEYLSALLFGTSSLNVHVLNHSKIAYHGIHSKYTYTFV